MTPLSVVMKTSVNRPNQWHLCLLSWKDPSIDPTNITFVCCHEKKSVDGPNKVDPARACSLYSDFLQCHRILSTKLLNQGFLMNRLILSFKVLVRKISTPCILSVAYRWRKMVLAIRFWFEIDYCFTFMSYDSLVYYLIFR